MISESLCCDVEAGNVGGATEGGWQCALCVLRTLHLSFPGSVAVTEPVTDLIPGGETPVVNQQLTHQFSPAAI